MKKLKGTKTEENLKVAFNGEAQTAMRYLYFANRAEIEGQCAIASLFRVSAAGEQGHALGHFEFLHHDIVSGLPIDNTRLNIQSAVEGETQEYRDMYPRMAEIAREEGFEEIANWFEILAKAERTHANQFQKAFDSLLD